MEKVDIEKTEQSPQDLMEELRALKAELQKQLQETPQKARKKPKVSKAWEEKRTIFLPRAHGREQNFVLVGVNGKRYQVPRGKQVEVPLPLYERLVLMQEAENRAYELRRRIADETENNATLMRVQ